MQKTGLCQICQKNEVDIYVITPQGESMEVCWECNNELTARYLGITLEPFRNGIYDFTGIRGRKHKFMIHKIIHPVGIGYQAVEVTENNTPGFRVEVLDELDCNQSDLFNKLEAKIKKTLFKRYLKSVSSPNGSKHTVFKTDEVVGRLEYDDNDKNHKVIIDGKPFSWDELGQMLNTYEGFQFKLKIYDITDDIE